MDGLRLILLLIGFLVLVAIYWWSTASKKRNRLRRRAVRGQRVREPLEPLGISPRVEGGVDFTGTLTDLGEMISAEHKGSRWRGPLSRAFELGRRLSGRGEPESSEQGHGEGGRTSEAQRHAAASDQVLVLYLSAPVGAPFNGLAIRDAAELCGMRFGEMDVFHHHGVGESRCERSLFCLANMFEPGSFDLAKLATVKTEGLALFMRLPTAIEGPLAFELMLSTARRLCERLGGELCDAERRSLRPTEISRMRHLAANVRA